MPINDDGGPDVLVDTSVAVALSVADHEGRASARSTVRGKRVGLAGYAANFSYTRFLDAASALALLDGLPAAGIAGGAVYDALVGAVAREHRVPLATRGGKPFAETFQPGHDRFDVALVVQAEHRARGAVQGTSHACRPRHGRCHRVATRVR